VEHGEK